MSGRQKEGKQAIYCNLYFIVSLLILLFWLFLIYRMSAKTGNESAGLSYKITETVYKLPAVSHCFPFDTLHFLVRKLAHFTEYGILSLFVMNFLNSCRQVLNDRNGNKRKDKNRKIAGYFAVFDILFCGIYASLDEYHQSFVDGRGPSVKDVWIDISGAFVFLIILGLGSRLWSKHVDKK